MSKFLDIVAEVLTAVAEASAEDRARSVAMDQINRNTQFLDDFAKVIVSDLSKMKTTSYYARRQIEAMRLSDNETTYLKRRIIMEASCVDYYAKSQIDHLLRTI